MRSPVLIRFAQYSTENPRCSVNRHWEKNTLISIEKLGKYVIFACENKHPEESDNRYREYTTSHIK